MDALVSAGFVTELAKFKPKDVSYRCARCGYEGAMVRHEETETDVAIGSRLIELSLRSAVVGIAVLSGDTDLAPAIRTARRLSAGKPIYVILPYKRYNNAFDLITTQRFSLKAAHCASHQFPDPIVLSDGTKIARPTEWV